GRPFASVYVGAGVHRGRVEEKPATRGHGGCYRFCAELHAGPRSRISSPMATPRCCPAGGRHLYFLLRRDRESAGRTPAHGETRNAVSPLGAGAGGLGNGCLPSARRRIAKWGWSSKNCFVGFRCDCSCFAGALGGRAIWTSAKPACRSRIRRNHSADDPSVPCCLWLVWHSDSKFRQQLEHFWSALRCLVPLPSSHIVWSVRCETCSRNILFLFWAGDRPDNPRPGATICCGLRSGYDSHEGTDRVLGGSSCRH